MSQLLDELQSKFGEGAVMRLGEVKAVGVEAIPTGSFSLDLATGVGGYPKGRIIEYTARRVPEKQLLRYML